MSKPKGSTLSQNLMADAKSKPKGSTLSQNRGQREVWSLLMVPVKVEATGILDYASQGGEE